MANITMNSPPPTGIQFIGPRQAVFAGAPVIVQAPASVSRGLNRHQLSSMKGLSIVQIICGVLSIIFDTALLAIKARFTVGSGIWCGLFFVVAGILGVVGAAYNRKCLFIATMVMSILSSIMLLVIVIFSTVLISYCNVKRWYNLLYNCYDEEYAFGSLLIVIAVVELIVSIWASALCCKGVSQVNTQLGTTSYTTQQPVYYTVQHSMGSQVTVLPPAAGFTVTQSPAFTLAAHQNQNPAYYPQQQYAAANTSYVAETAGPPPYSA